MLSLLNLTGYIFYHSKLYTKWKPLNWGSRWYIVIYGCRPWVHLLSNKSSDKIWILQWKYARAVYDRTRLRRRLEQFLVPYIKQTTYQSEALNVENSVFLHIRLLIISGLCNPASYSAYVCRWSSSILLSNNYCKSNFIPLENKYI